MSKQSFNHEANEAGPAPAHAHPFAADAMASAVPSAKAITEAYAETYTKASAHDGVSELSPTNSVSSDETCHEVDEALGAGAAKQALQALDTGHSMDDKLTLDAYLALPEDALMSEAETIAALSRLGLKDSRSAFSNEGMACGEPAADDRMAYGELVAEDVESQTLSTTKAQPNPKPNVEPSLKLSPKTMQRAEYAGAAVKNSADINQARADSMQVHSKLTKSKLSDSYSDKSNFVILPKPVRNDGLDSCKLKCFQEGLLSNRLELALRFGLLSKEEFQICMEELSFLRDSITKGDTALVDESISLISSATAPLSNLAKEHAKNMKRNA